ncbi:recombinase family protein [Natronincola ferrireducens]|uniref:Site-specific DNA recombinase n=1 Tax=Natronincola ferrireducens TaxID=393762 RepID=A0A1G9II16_9FIRM|nr:recombinase family protein [Natronincola ferrireducens]SDL24732.1 Site-specific DNA recombinase [Natronincola ferrireducens]
MEKVTVIKPKVYKNFNGKAKDEVKRVAAYCRVSTHHEEQLNSYQAQVSHYTALIQNNPEWELCDIFADEGISGTNSEKRPEFQRMIKEAKAGKIDLILTKSISRFARNTMDVLEYARMLRGIGVAIEFEKERINTLEASGEVMMTIFSSLAQEESRSISENSRWGIVKGFKDGKVFCNTTRFLGYDKDENGNLVVNKKEARIVKRIYQEYLEGKSAQGIAKGLEQDGIPTVTGNKKWWDSTITLILTNEKYYGALLQQKTVTVDFLTHKRVKNQGFADQYFIEENHEAIIPKEIWQRVQEEKERRALLKNNKKGDRGKYSSKYPFSSKIVCGDCNNTFKRRIWNSNNKSKKIVWQCKTYIQQGKDACHMKAVGEQVLKDAFVKVFNDIQKNKEGFTKTLLENIEKVLKKRFRNNRIEEIDENIENIKKELKALVKLQTTGKIDGEVYNEEYMRISQELETLRKEKGKFERANEAEEEYKDRVKEIIEIVDSMDRLLEEFNDEIFNALVEKIEILEPRHFVFVLKSGVRVEEIVKNP